MRARRTVTTAVLAGALVAGAGAVAGAAPPDGSRTPAGSGGAAAQGGVATALPPGWRISTTGDGPALVWTAPGTVRKGDAAVEFFAGDRLLGRPVPAGDGRTFRLDLAGRRLGDPAELRVRAGGRRLDAPAPATRRATPPAAEPAPAPAPAPAHGVDPGRPGPYRTITGEYALRPVRLPGFDVPVELLGVVVAPAGATGRRPLVLFLHGRHDTCFTGDDEEGVSGDWPCPAGADPIPSHRGYLRAQRLLASQGYVTVSIAANGVNGQDHTADDGGAQARSSLVRHHLARWADWAGARRGAAPAIVRAAPRADLSDVLLVGHSRGGEGVNRAAMDSLSPPPAAQDGYRGPVRWRIDGTVGIGPTIFGHNPAPDVPSLTILPGCDGDVSDLQGQLYVDGTRGVSRGAALHSSVYLVGANHNYFNTEWTPGQAAAPAWDDFSSEEPDRVCTPGLGTRLTPSGQQAAGATYVAAAARLFVAGDDRVRPLLDGTGVRAPSAGPARALTHALGAARTPLLVPAATTRVRGAGARLCAQVSYDPETGCLVDDEGEKRSPHFVGFDLSAPEPGRYSVALRWDEPGRRVTVRPARPASVAGAEAVALRVIVPPDTTGTRLDVAVTDAAGRRAHLGQVRLDGLPGTARTTSYWGQEVRVPAAAAVRAGLDLRRVSALELTPRGGAGEAWLVDAWGWRPGSPPARPAALPRVDIGELEVREGDSGVRTLRVPVTVSGSGHGTVRFFVEDPATAATTERVVTIRPGTRTVVFRVRVRGDTRYGYDELHLLAAKAVRGVVVGDYAGGVIVHEDDPPPEVTVTPVADRVAEGESLTWRVALSEAAEVGVWAEFQVVPPAAGAELSSADVDPSWFEDMTGLPPLPPWPLSDVLWLFTAVPPGEPSADVTVPTVADGAAEGEEHLRLRQVFWPPDAEEPAYGPEFGGTVVDRP